MTPASFRPIEPRAVEVARAAMLTGSGERQARKLMPVICEPTRIGILRALMRTPLAASDLAHVLGRTRSATSQHLRALREVEAVTAERRGNVMRYRLATSLAAQVLADVAAAFDKLSG